MVNFRSKTELANFLRKGMEIEQGFESMSQWEGYVQARTDVFRQTMFTMISDSEHHAGMVAAALELLGVPESESYKLRAQSFDFSNKEEAEVMRELSRFEKLALDTYTNIYTSLMASNTAGWLPEYDRKFILDTLDTLIKDETRHCEIASRCIGKVERIR